MLKRKHQEIEEEPKQDQEQEQREQVTNTTSFSSKKLKLNSDQTNSNLCNSSSSIVNNLCNSCLVSSGSSGSSSSSINSSSSVSSTSSTSSSSSSLSLVAPLPTPFTSSMPLVPSIQASQILTPILTPLATPLGTPLGTPLDTPLATSLVTPSLVTPRITQRQHWRTVMTTYLLHFIHRDLLEIILAYSTSMDFVLVSSIPPMINSDPYANPYGSQIELNENNENKSTIIRDGASIAVSEDGKCLFACDRFVSWTSDGNVPGSVKVFEMDTGRFLRSWALYFEPTGVTSVNNKLYVCGGGKFQIFNMNYCGDSCPNYFLNISPNYFLANSTNITPQTQTCMVTPLVTPSGASGSSGSSGGFRGLGRVAQQKRKKVWVNGIAVMSDATSASDKIFVSMSIEKDYDDDDDRWLTEGVTENYALHVYSQRKSYSADSSSDRSTDSSTDSSPGSSTDSSSNSSLGSNSIELEKVLNLDFITEMYGCNQMILGDDNHLWIGRRGGVTIIDPSDGRIVQEVERHRFKVHGFDIEGSEGSEGSKLGDLLVKYWNTNEVTVPFGEDIFYCDQWHKQVVVLNRQTTRLNRVINTETLNIHDDYFWYPSMIAINRQKQQVLLSVQTKPSQHSVSFSRILVIE